jgi:hypothetical protein
VIAMQIPDEFFDFRLYLHQDSFYVYGTDPKDIAAGAIKHMSKAQQQNACGFLDELLTGNYSDDQLQEIYRRGDPEISFSPLRCFFGLVRDTINRGA